MANFLQIWYEDMLKLKWQRQYHGERLFENLQEVKNEIEQFFDPNDFIIEEELNSKNWLLHVLHDRQPGAVALVVELAELLRYLRLSKLQIFTAFTLKTVK
ncbi:hypothetical protein OQZ33_17120 [Pedobacter sp. MC2016-05]|uniref:hypothetical protein n=1 Tax=Pedobacter sp. MC2016-05 TaxID=2994474 RepID=UPI002245C040|nr:hypothetical protein [Pedobacter sp. MC2016-05]MCX2476058.1 hypothetical protein [Pedobacter sp. MC2016-05]